MLRTYNAQSDYNMVSVVAKTAAGREVDDVGGEESPLNDLRFAIILRIQSRDIQKQT